MHFNGLVLLAVEEVHLVPPSPGVTWPQFSFEREKKEKKGKKKGIKGCVVVVFSSDGRPGNENERFSAPQKPAFTSVCPSLRAPARLSDADASHLCVCVFFFCLRCVFFSMFKKERKMSVRLVPTLRTRQMKICEPLPPPFAR